MLKINHYVPGAIFLSGLFLTGCDSSNNNSNNASAPPPLPTTLALEGEPCKAPAGATMFITLDCVDPEYQEAFIDIDEQRTTTDTAKNVTVSYRYVHGGFTDTNTRFAYYFPESAQYQGRFFESTYPTVSVEGADRQPNCLCDLERRLCGVVE